MRCRTCNSRNTRVTTTDSTNAGLTKRYCRCLDCKAHYQTTETYLVLKPGPKLGSKTGTKVCGSAHPQSVLTETDVIRLRDMYQNGTRQVELVKIFGVNKTTIYKIVHRKKWTHV
jgi:hypothetical protein